MKTCTTCHIDKPDSEFCLRTGRKTRMTHCKRCCDDKRKLYLAARPEQTKMWSIKRGARKANTTVEAVLQAYKDQNHCCAICFRPESDFKKGLCVDHCHTTGKFRGILCHRCNTSIGQMDDDTDRMLRAIQYIKGK